MADGSVTIDTKLDDNGFKKGLGSLEGVAKKFSTGLKTTMAIGTAAIGTTTTALVALGKASLESYAQLEQNIGGIETLFKKSADKVIKNANNAYKTAGMSANQYMANVTSFSASLLQSVANDTEKAADIADMAMIDMSDNANKMGTDMALIQNAYQGFAKQNYTMLDNLKLGYGGTKTEMERLLKDAQKLSGVKYDISNLADVYEAIHVIQKELHISGITAEEAAKLVEAGIMTEQEAFELLGTTAKEAEATISGSIASLKASWDNFLNGSGDIGTVIKNLTTVTKNVLNAVTKMMPRIVSSITEAMPELLKAGGELIGSLAQGIMDNLPMMLDSAVLIIDELLQRTDKCIT